MTSEHERVNTLFVMLIVFVILTYTFPRWADPNQNSRLDMIFAVVDQGTFQIDDYVWNTVDFAKVDGHYYSDKAPGIALLSIPFYASLKQLFALPLVEDLTDHLSNSQSFISTLREEGTGVSESKVQFALTQVVLVSLFAAIPTVLISAFLYRYLARFIKLSSLRLILAIAYAILTPAFAYGGSLYGHQLSALMLLVGFIGISNSWFDVSATRTILLGFVLAFAVLTEYPAALGVLVIGTWAVVRYIQNRKWDLVSGIVLGGLPVLLVFMVYNQALFGGPFEIGYKYSELWLDQHSSGLFSISSPRLDALWGITFSSYRGLFFLSPWLLLSIPGWLYWKRSNQNQSEFWVISLIVLAFILFNISSEMWWGGYAVGPRYFLPAMPFMVLPVSVTITKYRQSVLFQFVLGVIFLWSFILTWGFSLADQAFPPDVIYRPLEEYVLPNWRSGNIARNYGHLMGLRGGFSLFPLTLILAAIVLGWRLITGKHDMEAAMTKNT